MTATEPHPGDRGPRDGAAGRELLDRDALNPWVSEIQAVNLRMQRVHLFEPESLVPALPALPAVPATAIILMAFRRVARASTRTWLFR